MTLEDAKQTDSQDLDDNKLWETDLENDVSEVVTEKMVNEDYGAKNDWWLKQLINKICR